MINIPCPKPPALCEDDSNPFANLSSEGVDGPLYISRWSEGTFFDPPLGRGVPVNPEDCVSTVSQEEADICAQNNARRNNVNFPSVVFNQAVSCTRHCPDGLPFTYVVNANRFTGYTQQEADGTAFSYACLQAQRHIICFGKLPSQPCLNIPYDEEVLINSYYPVTVDIVAGELPDGLEWEINSNGNIRIFGTATESGAFEFTFRADSNFGDFFLKPYVITVGDSPLFSWEGPIWAEWGTGPVGPGWEPDIITGRPRGIEYRTAEVGACSGTLTARALTSLDPDAQGAWAMEGSRVLGASGLFTVRLRGTAKNGFVYGIVPDSALGTSLKVSEPTKVGDTVIDELKQLDLTIPGPSLLLYWGVIVPEGETEAQIDLDFTITKL